MLLLTDISLIPTIDMTKLTRKQPTTRELRLAKAIDSNPLLPSDPATISSGMWMAGIISGYVYSGIARRLWLTGKAVSMALERAKETIYIADWWLSPELFLRRPPYYNQEWRLDQILKRKAEEGVMIYVIVYREVEVSTADLTYGVMLISCRLLSPATPHTRSMPSKPSALKEQKATATSPSCATPIIMFSRTRPT